MIDVEWLQILCCPETRQNLVEATEADLQKVNQQVAEGRLRNRAGQVITERLDALLVRQDGRVGYPVRQAIPVMLASEALILEP